MRYSLIIPQHYEQSILRPHIICSVFELINLGHRLCTFADLSDCSQNTTCHLSKNGSQQLYSHMRGFVKAMHGCSLALNSANLALLK